MLSGQQILGSIDGALSNALNEAKSIDGEVGALTDHLLGLRHDQAEAYQALARMRLSQLDGDGVLEELSAAERQARQLLNERSDGLHAIDRQLETVERELADLTARQARLIEGVETAKKGLAEAERHVLEELAKTDAYQEQRAAVENAEAVARRAEQKTAFAEEDRQRKGQAYEDDLLFLYLWKRGWGTPRYEGGRIARYFDAKIARLIAFDKARANYAMLLEIPKRLAEHAQSRREVADDQAKRLADLEAKALSARAVAEPRNAAAKAQAELDAFEDQIEAAQQRRSDLMAERAQVTSGEDSKTREATSLVVTALGRQDLRTLRRQAERTPTPADDTIVDRIQDIDREIETTERAITEQKALQAEHRRRTTELERVRRDYRQGGYGRDMFDMRDTDVLSVLLGQVLGGALSRDGLWDQINRRRVAPRRGGFGWPRGGGGGFPAGGGVRRGGGGFRTGGGF